MRRHTWIVCMSVGLFAWLGMGTGFAEFIYPVNPQTNLPNTSSNVTLSILKTDGVTDITGDPDQYPIPDQPFLVRLNNGPLLTSTSVVLVDIPSSLLTTSRYPGVCTNWGEKTNTDLDFAPPVFVSSDRFQLTPKDLGGRAVVKINNDNNLIFAIPQDTNLDGIPDIYERKYGFAVEALARDADIDTGPDPSVPSLSPVGDGIANIDEYRGFRVGGVYKRGNPKQKDLFVHLEDVAQCTGAAGTFNYTGINPNPVRLATFFPNGLDPSPPLPSLYANVDALPNAKVHRINNQEWVSKFVAYDINNNNYVILSGTDSETLKQDRWINKNSIATNPKVVKGVRIIECLDMSTLSPLGESDKRPPDLIDTKDNGNAIIYVHRIVKTNLNLITGPTLTQPLVHYAYENGWVSKGNIGGGAGKILNPSNPSVLDPTFISLMQLALPWYIAHEALEHSYDVTATVQTTRKASYGYHHADLSGTNVDIKITNTLTNTANKFYIPKYFAISDEREMRVLSTQVTP